MPDGSIDDDLAERLARAHGWEGLTVLHEQEYVQLPRFGPRKYSPSDEYPEEQQDLGGLPEWLLDWLDEDVGKSEG